MGVSEARQDRDVNLRNAKKKMCHLSYADNINDLEWPLMVN